MRLTWWCGATALGLVTACTVGTEGTGENLGFAGNAGASGASGAGADGGNSGGGLGATAGASGTSGSGAGGDGASSGSTSVGGTTGSGGTSSDAGAAGSGSGGTAGASSGGAGNTGTGGATTGGTSGTGGTVTGGTSGTGNAGTGGMTTGGTGGSSQGPGCGDGYIDLGEQCDDANTNDDDGCKRDCAVKCVTGTLRPENGSCYWLKKDRDADDWLAAANRCVAEGGHLVTIGDASENAWVDTFANHAIWIGASDGRGEKQSGVGTYGWVDQKPLNYTNWSGGEPNAYKHNIWFEDYFEHCARMENNGTWNDQLCRNENWFVCERDAPGQRR